jgi:hypothetical protein
LDEGENTKAPAVRRETERIEADDVAVCWRFTDSNFAGAVAGLRFPADYSACLVLLR